MIYPNPPKNTLYVTEFIEIFDSNRNKVAVGNEKK